MKQLTQVSMVLSTAALLLLSGCGKNTSAAAGSQISASDSSALTSAAAAATTATNSVGSTIGSVTGTSGVTGATGTTGAASAVVNTAVRVVPATLAQCKSGGSAIEVFSDANQNGVLDSGEKILSTTPVCNGLSPTISEAPATKAQCPNGGVVYTTSDEDGIPEVSVVCNGLNGAVKATPTPAATPAEVSTVTATASGAVGPMISGEKFSACHYEYSFLASKSESKKGWIIFHRQSDQKSTQADLKIWSEDAAKFDLLSQDGSATYCKVKWSAKKKALRYKVIESKYKMGGYIGQIQF